MSVEEIPGGVRCPLCGLWFKNQKALNAHMKKHKNERKRYGIDPDDSTQATAQTTTPMMQMPMQFDNQQLPQLPMPTMNFTAQQQNQAGAFLGDLIARIIDKAMDKWLGKNENNPLEQLLMQKFMDWLSKSLDLNTRMLEKMLENLGATAGKRAGEQLGEVMAGGAQQ